MVDGYHSVLMAYFVSLMRLAWEDCFFVRVCVKMVVRLR